MPLTLVEMAKNSTDPVRQGVIETYYGSSALLAVMPLQNIQGNALKYNREGNLPGVAFRGVNESFTESTGIINPLSESLAIAGGDADVDTFLVNTMGAGRRGIEEGMKIKALGLYMTKTIIKGDSESDPREFDGLQKRVTGDQLIAAGATANGTPLSLLKLDEAIDQTEDPTHILMNKTIARRLSAAARDGDVAGNVNYSTDELGKRIMTYNGLPIITIDKDNEGNAILPFTEAATSGTATATSIYILSLGPDKLSGIQNGEIQVRDLGELDDKPVLRTRMEWYMSIIIYHGRSVTRIWSISDAAVTA